MNKNILNIFKYLFIWLIGGIIYYMIEILYRGYSHPSMFILGGICLIIIGLLNEVYSWNLYFELQVLIGDIIVITLECITGFIVNIWLGWNVWDYSDMPFNFYGQICPQFALLWIPVIIAAILLDDWLRYKYLGEEKPRYRFFIKKKAGTK